MEKTIDLPYEKLLKARKLRFDGDGNSSLNHPDKKVLIFISEEESKVKESCRNAINSVY